jgi:organic anion transporter 3A
MLLPFMVLLFFMTLMVAITQMPLLMVVLRSVAEEEKAFALGIQFVIFRLFGYIPSPIIFGNVIDSTCLLWKQTCEGSQVVGFSNQLKVFFLSSEKSSFCVRSKNVKG